MSSTLAPIRPAPLVAPSDPPAAKPPEVVTLLNDRVGLSFGLWDGETGAPLYLPPDAPAGDESLLRSLVPAAAVRDEVQFLADEPPVMLLGIPLVAEETGRTFVAVAAAVCEHPLGGSLGDSARMLGQTENRLADWIAAQPRWTPSVLGRLARAARGEWEARIGETRARGELHQISHSLANTYEEISLLYSLTQHLRLSGSDTELAETSLDWLADCLRAESVVVLYLPVAAAGQTTYRCRTEPVMVQHGGIELSAEQFAELVRKLELQPKSGPFVANEPVTAQADWPLPQIHNLVVVPLSEGERVFGWMMAANRKAGAEFGTVEASLCASVAAILGIHSGNVDLYRRQQEFLAGVVRALSSAIDAKDNYTAGHSDRVARLAVRLGAELGLEQSQLSTLYMAGLLHDIGKIGINDAVLRKPGRLTPEEFAHIQKHPELGARILQDLNELAEVVPVVLHHHEQWDGQGYPGGLGGEEIPFLARIAAVADAYDAMHSDRPYRKGMPLEKVESIFREGAGKQWDAGVIEAYFRCRDEIQAISANTRADLTLDLSRWEAQPARTFTTPA